MTESFSPTRDVVRSALVRSPAKRSPLWACRVLDLWVAVLALLLFGPVMALVALSVASERRGPILFRHTRIGKGGVSFRVYKFRTMAVDSDRILAEHLAANPEAAAEWALNHKLKKDPRVSSWGRLLRQASLDELPQLFNVLRGEMSIVGPRPIVAGEVSRYGRAFKHYCAVQPGLTGIWQVSGRNDISYKRRVAMDALYSRRKSVLLDMLLITATIPAVLARKGSY